MQGSVRLTYRKYQANDTKTWLRDIISEFLNAIISGIVSSIIHNTEDQSFPARAACRGKFQCLARKAAMPSMKPLCSRSLTCFNPSALIWAGLFSCSPCMNMSAAHDRCVFVCHAGGADKGNQEWAARDGCLRRLHHPGTGHRTGAPGPFPRCLICMYASQESMNAAP